MFEVVRRRLGEWGDRHFISLSASMLTLMILLFFCLPRMVITIPAGHGGALWLRFFGGTVPEFHYGEGTKLIFPWDRIYVYDLRVQQRTAEFDVLTNEGLLISTEATIRFRLLPESLGAVTAYAGPDFIETLVVPSVGALARQEAAKHTAEEIYSTSRRAIEEDIFRNIGPVIDNLIPAKLHPGSEIVIQDFWFRSIKLPEKLQASIETKLTQRQLAEQYRFILQREEQEKERKRIEAEGIKAFQDIVTSGITDSYLRWKGIDATLKLADSPNAKMVIIGAAKDGLPLILGPWDNSTAPPGPPKADAPGQTAGRPPLSDGSATASPLPPATPAMPLATNPKISLPANPAR